MERQLYVIPVIHTRADAGTLGHQLPENAFENAGIQFWQDVEKFVQASFISEQGIRLNKVYQDGLPDYKDEEEVTKTVTEIQSENYKVLRQLRAAGVRPRGTEKPAALEEEYDYLESIQNAKDAKYQQKLIIAYTARMGNLLKERDQYIAQRITHDLAQGEIGLLFIGLAHRVVPLLQNKLRVIELHDFKHPLTQSLNHRH